MYGQTVVDKAAPSSRAVVAKKVFVGTDADALQDHLRAITPGLRVAPLPSEGPFHAHSLLVELGDVKAWRNSYSRPFQISSLTPPDNLVLGIPTRGGLQVAAGVAHDATVGRVLSFHPREIEHLEIRPETKTDSLSIPRTTLNSRLAQLLDRTQREVVRFQPVVESTDAGGAAVRSVLQGLLHTATCSPSRSTEALQTLSTALIDLVLEALPHSHTEALQRPPIRIGPRQVRRALAYIRDQPMPVLTTDELADICGVSVRSLQYTFREFVGVAPAEYWRKVRLERAVAQIKSSPTDSVSRIAAEWGFSNVTRFRALAGLVDL